MRLRLGRPDLGRYADRFAVPAAEGDFAVTFLGVATLLLADGESAVMTDGFFSRPSLVKVGLGKLAPNLDRIDQALTRTGTRSLEGVLPVHTHFDHALDSAVVADRTGALLIGGESAANLGRGHGLRDEQLRVVRSHESLALGNFTLTWIESDHCPPDRYPGAITEPVSPPAKAQAYRVRGVVVHHRRTPQRSKCSDPRQRRVRSWVAHRTASRGGVPRDRSARRARRGLLARLLG